MIQPLVDYGRCNKSQGEKMNGIEELMVDIEKKTLNYRSSDNISSRIYWIRMFYRDICDVKRKIEEEFSLNEG